MLKNRGERMLKPKQKKCIELLVEGQMTQREIAQAINITEKTISVWKSETEFSSELENATRLSIRSLAAKAKNIMANLLNSDSDNVRFQAAKDILDRAGFKPQEKIEVSKSIDDSIREMEDYLCEKKSENI